MKTKTILAAAVLAALAGGYQGFAEISAVEDSNTASVIGDTEISCQDLAKYKNYEISGTGKNPSLTVTTPGQSANGVILVQGNEQNFYKFSDLDSFTVKTSDDMAKYTGMGVIVASNSAFVSFDNVKNIQFGSADAMLDNTNGDMGPVLCAFSGKVSIGSEDKRSDEVNIYAKGSGISAQQQSDNNKAGHIDIYAKNINISASGFGVSSAVYATGAGNVNRDETTSVNLDASDSIHITGTTENTTGVQISDFYPGTKPEGNANLTLHAGKDIEISATKSGSYGIMIYRQGEYGGNSALNITSEQGKVDIEGNTYGLIARGNSSANIAGVIQGKEVSIKGTAEPDANNAGCGAGVILFGAKGKATIGEETVEGLTLQGDTINVSGTTALYTQDSSILNLQGTGSHSVINLTSTVENGNAINAAGGSTVTLGDGTHATDVNINGYVNVSGADSKLTFENNTTTHVDSKYLTNENKAFITADNDKAVTFEEGAKLDIGNVAANTKLNFSNNENIRQAAADNIVTDNLLQNVIFDKETNQLTVGTVSEDEAAERLGGSALTNVALAATEKNLDGVTALITNNASDTDAVKAALNSAAGLSGLANVAHGTYTMNGLFSDAVSGHLMNRQDQDVWAYGFHSKENVNGLSFSGDYDAQYNGVTAGVDLYKNGGTTAGVALTYGDSNVSGSNGLAATRSDADYYGASIYGRFDRGSYALLGDISYMKGDHDVTQVNSGETITASPDSDSISVGVKALKDYAAGENGTLTPYVGLRYLRLSTDDFTASNGLHYVGDDQDMVIVPVGVNYTASISHGKWSVRPYAGIGYVWTAGDRSTDQTVMLGGKADSFSYDTADSSSFIARVGVTTDCDDMSYGIGYSWQKGDSVSNNAWTVSASYHF